MPLPPPAPQSEHSRSVFRNNLDGETAWQRHQRYVRSAQLYESTEGGSSSSVVKRTDFDALKDAHKFIREEDEGTSSLSYDETVALKYYKSLFKEYACCDLKHFKRGDVALRWRTEGEVISGAGQFTCGNTRCACHEPESTKDRQPPQLVTLEVPFAYVEQGEKKAALVKIVLCKRCRKKLTWKRDQDKLLAYAAEMADDASEELDEDQWDPETEERKKQRDVRIGSGMRRYEKEDDDLEMSYAKRSRRERRRSASPAPRRKR